METLALFYTAFAVTAIGVRVFGGQLIDTHGRRAVIVPSMLVQTGAVALLALLGFFVSRTSLRRSSRCSSSPGSCRAARTVFSTRAWRRW